MPIKRPVTLAQARVWPAAAKRRESFCARMGGMRDNLTGPKAASDPGSRINRALAAWDCDKPEGLQRKHVSKGIRQMKITSSMIGSEAGRKTNPANTFNASQIARLKSEYSKINRIDPDSEHYEKLLILLDGLDLKSLKALADANIKFVSGLARNRVFRRTNERKTNPSGRDAGEFVMTVDGKRVTRFFVHATDEWAISHGFPYRLLSHQVEHGAPIRFMKTRAIVAVDEDADGKPITETWEIRGLKFWSENPDPVHPWAKLGKVFTYQGRKWEVIGYSHNGEWFTARQQTAPHQSARFSVAEMMGKRKTNPHSPPDHASMRRNFAKEIVSEIKRRMKMFGDPYEKAKSMALLGFNYDEETSVLIDEHFLKRKTNPDVRPDPVWISKEKGIGIFPVYIGPGEYKMQPEFLDLYMPSAASARDLAEWAADEFKKRGYQTVVYVVYGLTSVSKRQTKKRTGFTITTTPAHYPIAYAFK